MNKYLKKFNEVIDQFNKELNGSINGGYALFNKLIIANEFDCCWTEELTDEQEEWLIEEVYDFYISNDYNSISSIVNAYIRTIAELDGITNLVALEKDNPAELRDKIIWNIVD